MSPERETAGATSNPVNWGSDTAIAIVGMAGRFPGAADVDTFWQRLCDGVVSIRDFDDDELRSAGVPEELFGRPDYVPAGADLADVDQFDSDFFDVPRYEARITDPQQRVFLECAWRALVDAGHDPKDIPGRVGLFGATGVNSYLSSVLLPAGHLPADGISYPVLLGNEKDFLCTRVSYRLGLTGPSMTVQTACSASLVAVHLAVGSLLAGECEVALAGGVSVRVPGTAGYLYRDHGILSQDGRCRVFDASATGTVRGDGCGVVVLRRLSEALADRDNVYGVIRGTAVNNDGSDKVGFTAPGVSGQIEVIREAHAVADIPASEIGYVEAHGTGTRLGDPIELRGLSAAHEADGEPPRHCYLGAVKANIGHLDAAAGIAGLIKTVLVLRNQTIPAQPGFDTANPELAQFLARYEVPTKTVRPQTPLRAAAVSSFGLGGTNAHAVLVPAAVDRRPQPPGRRYLVVLSTRDTTALRELADRLREHLVEHPDTRIDDVALTMVAGRVRYPVRAAILASCTPELVEQLAALTADPGHSQPTTELDGALPRAHARWVAGGDLAPEEVGDLTSARRTSLPAHPLRPVRCWVDQAPGESSTSSAWGPDERSPQSTSERTLRQTLAVVEHVLDVTELGPDEDLFDLGLDSMEMVELVARLGEQVGIRPRFEEFSAARTAREFADGLARCRRADGPALDRSGLSEPGASPAVRDVDSPYRRLLVKVREAHREADAGNVFLVHPAGGTTVCYVDFAQYVRDQRAIWALAFPMAEAERFPTVRDLARLYVDLIREVQPRGPYRIGGYSFGGNVAVEMALVLEASGEVVEQVIAIDSHPPEAYIGGSAGPAEFVAAFPALVAAIVPGEFHPPRSQPQSLAEAIDSVRQPSWSDAFVREIEGFYSVWVHNHQALKRWYPDRPLRAELVILAGTEEEDGSILDWLEIRRTAKEPWSHHVDGPLRVVPIGGNHYTIMRDPRHLRALGLGYDAVMAGTRLQPHPASQPGTHRTEDET